MTNESNNELRIEYELDLSNAGRDVFLVKVPNYIAETWEKASGDVGTLKISHVPGQRQQARLIMSEAVLSLKEPRDPTIPKEIAFDMSNITRQSLRVFSHEMSSTSSIVAPNSQRLNMEGKIVKKLECKPYVDNIYYKSKSMSIKNAHKPQRQVKQLDKIVQNYKPVSDHKCNIQYLERKKAEGKKARDNKEAVLDMLFAAFEKHQYYNTKDLQNITKQPTLYLKKILREICNYQLSNPHKNMWELKPEYRHYKQDNPFRQ